MKLLSHVRLFVTPWTVAYQPTSSMGFFQARVLEWVAISFSRGSSQPRDRTGAPALQADALLSEPPGKLGPPLGINFNIFLSFCVLFPYFLITLQ